MNKIILYATLHGYLWSGSEAQAEKTKRVDRRARNVKLKALLTNMLSGDFEKAKFTSDSMLVFSSTRQAGKYVVTRERSFPITAFPSLAALVCKEVTWHES